MRHHPSACRLANLLIKSHLGNFCQVNFASLSSCMSMLKISKKVMTVASHVYSWWRRLLQVVCKALVEKGPQTLRELVLTLGMLLKHSPFCLIVNISCMHWKCMALSVICISCDFLHLRSCSTLSALIQDYIAELSRLAFQFWRECAEFEHLKEASLKEKRQQADKIVRTSLQILLQHSYVLSYLVYPAITKTNKAPVAYHIYTVDVAAIIRCVRYCPSLYLYDLSAMISWGRDKLCNSI